MADFAERKKKVNLLTHNVHTEKNICTKTNPVDKRQRPSGWRKYRRIYKTFNNTF